MPNIMLRNNRGMGFQNITTSGGFGHLQKGHGVAFADLDNDGDQDIYHQLGGFYPSDKYHNALFLNPGNNSHFLNLRLVARSGNRQAIGARISILTHGPEGPIELHRSVGSVSSFGGSPIRQEVGLGAASSITRLQIKWPVSGITQTIKDVPIDAFIDVTEGEIGFQRRTVSQISFPHPTHKAAVAPYR
jgi:hypothetical protein